MTRDEFDIRRDFDVRRAGTKLETQERELRMRIAPEKIEFIGGIFAGDQERRLVLGMILEILGIDTAVEYGRLDDWKAAIAARERREQADQSN
jgi:hypothetical protein